MHAIVFCPKYRFKIFSGDISEYTRQQTYSVFRQKERVEVLELNVQEDIASGDWRGEA